MYTLIAGFILGMLLTLCFIKCEGQVVQKKFEQSAVYRVQNFESDIHSMPQDDLFEHMPDANCPCSPFLDPKIEQEIRMGLATKYVFVHKQVKYNKEDLV